MAATKVPGIAALGKLRRAEVVTGDPEFQKLKGEITTIWKVN